MNGNEPVKSSYLDYLQDIAESDVRGLRKAEASYGDSWKKRGGVGAFMMLARKWDRIEKMLDPEQTPNDKAWDIFAAVTYDERMEGMIDDIRDLRRYLMLVEAEMKATGATSALTEQRDSAK